MEIKFQGQVWSRKFDHENEATVVFRIPSSEFINVCAIPSETLLTISVKGGESDSEGKNSGAS